MPMFSKKKEEIKNEGENALGEAPPSPEEFNKSLLDENATLKQENEELKKKMYEPAQLVTVTVQDVDKNGVVHDFIFHCRRLIQKMPGISLKEIRVVTPEEFNKKKSVEVSMPIFNSELPEEDPVKSILEDSPIDKTY